jgi:hypothetical protein
MSRVIADEEPVQGARAGTAKKAFLTSMEPELVQRIKAAAALRETASSVLNDATKKWLEQHQDGGR